jgi:hypothetical protein
MNPIAHPRTQVKQDEKRGAPSGWAVMYAFQAKQFGVRIGRRHTLRLRVTSS